MKRQINTHRQVVWSRVSAQKRIRREDVFKAVVEGFFKTIAAVKEGGDGERGGIGAEGKERQGFRTWGRSRGRASQRLQTFIHSVLQKQNRSDNEETWGRTLRGVKDLRTSREPMLSSSGGEFRGEQICKACEPVLGG